jgi:hypothetical protein
MSCVTVCTCLLGAAAVVVLMSAVFTVLSTEIAKNRSSMPCSFLACNVSRKKGVEFVMFRNETVRTSRGFYCVSPDFP